MDELVIAEAGPDDLDELAAMVNASYLGDSARQSWTSEAELISGQRTDAATLADELSAPDPSTILMLRDASGGAIHACVMTQTFRDDADRHLCHLAMLTVRPGEQARGLGRRLIGEVERRARNAGCVAVELTVIHVRETLIAYYERRGYRRTGKTKPFPYGDPRVGTPLRDDLHFVVLENALSSAI